MIPGLANDLAVIQDQRPSRTRFTPTWRRGYLIDRWGRRHTDLRISITDRCNLRCVYCMPPEGAMLAPREALLDFDEIERVVQAAARLGIQKVRLTGGEPLLRKDLPSLIRRLAAVPGLVDLAMTTNGALLADYAAALREAGLRRLNISLDTLDRRQFQTLSGQDALPDVLRGIDAAQQAGFQPIKLNALAIRGFNESQIIPLARFALERGLEIRFIEFMPIGQTGQWSPERVLSAESILKILRQEFGSVDPIESVASMDEQMVGYQTAVAAQIGPSDMPPPMDLPEPGSAETLSTDLSWNASANLPFGEGRAPVARPPARQYLLRRLGARIGVIPSVSEPFCLSCCRLRLTAQGELRHCLFAQTGQSVRECLRQGGTDEQIMAIFQAAVASKPLTPQRRQNPLVMAHLGG